MFPALFITTLVVSSVPNALHDAVVSDDFEALQAAIKSGASPEVLYKVKHEAFVSRRVATWRKKKAALKLKRMFKAANMLSALSGV